MEASRVADNLPVLISLGDLARGDGAVVRVDQRVGHAAQDAPESTAVHIRWRTEGKTQVDAVWLPIPAQQLRTLGGPLGHAPGGGADLSP
eukprot:6608645-Alexandrium_andersonii.AAC.1